MIKVVPFVPEHFEKIVLRDCYKRENISVVGMKAATFLLENEPMAIVGAQIIFDGVLQAWALTSDLISKKPIAFTKACKLMLKNQIEEHKIRRVQITVRTDYDHGWNWAIALGFELEGIMRNYGPDGCDYGLFAMVVNYV